MSFTDPELQVRIQNLKDQFEVIDFESESQSMVDQDDFSIRLAVISNLFKTMEASLDQISVCFEVSKAMFFYKDAIVNNLEFWAEERVVNQMLCSNNFRMANVDMDEAGKRLNAEVGFMQAQQGANQDSVMKVLGLVEGYQTLVGRFHEHTSFLTEAQGRSNMNLPLYDADQKPQIGEVSPEAYLKSLHMRSSQNTDAALVKNADLADSFFASIHFMKASGVPLGDIQPTATALALVLDRFEALEDARDNRHGFTQIRFG